jgi:L-ascorbate metabolism protein UlaG (beta-lactamase superfamily)
MDHQRSRAQSIRAQQEEIVRRFPAFWQEMITDWSQPGMEDRAWLMYSANYLLRTNNVHWAIDPVRLEHRLIGAPAVDYRDGLKNLSFVLLTHQHGDHLDLDLIRSLGDLPITWVVPELLLALVQHEAGLSMNQVVIPQPLQPMELRGIRITPFEGMHWEKNPGGPSDTNRGVPAIGYLVEQGKKRWLFPGDTRTYDASLLPCFGPVDLLFAHIWLGRGCALHEQPALLDAFCHFCLDLQPRRVVLTHLREFGRALEDYWDIEHAVLVSSRFAELSAALPMLSALIGDSTAL